MVKSDFVICEAVMSGYVLKTYVRRTRAVKKEGARDPMSASQFAIRQWRQISHDNCRVGDPTLPGGGQSKNRKSNKFIPVSP